MQAGKTYSFSLNSLTSADITAGSMTLAGSGTAYITGFDLTEGNFAISGTGPNLSFQFVTGSSTVVPDGGSTVTLFGFALVAVIGLQRKLRVNTA